MFNSIETKALKKGIDDVASDLAEMAIDVGTKANIINSAYIFADNTVRDAYFTTNPTERVTGLIISVGSGFQEWNGISWINKTAIVEDLSLRTDLLARGITCSQLKMVANDNNEAVNNANKLISGLNTYGKVIVDDVFYLKAPTISLTERNIELVGIKKGEFRFNHTAGLTVFNPADLTSIKLVGLKMTNETINVVMFIYSASKLSTHLSMVSIDGCEFNGSISLYRHSGDQLIDPTVTFFGIDTYVFSNNIVNNIMNSFIILLDLPVTTFIAENNKITNFYYEFISIGITNGITYDLEIASLRKFAKIHNNYVYCKDDWFCPSASYYTFFLFEGYECSYSGNHIEGLKTLTNSPTYDAYFSCEILNYINNVWKNNICFYATKSYNTLLKSKGSATGNASKRYYSNNTYIVEESYAAKVGQDVANLYVEFLNLTSNCDEYVIENNIFDIYDLRFGASGNPHSNFKVINNKFKCKYAVGTLAIVTLTDTFDIENIIIKNNTMSMATAVGSGFRLVQVNDSRSISTSVVGKIIVESNYIEAPFGYVFYTPMADTLICKDNTMIDNGVASSGFMFNGYYTNSFIDNNYIESLSSTSFYEGRQLYGSGGKYENIKLIRKNVVSDSNALKPRYNDTSTTPTYYRRKYKIYTNTGIIEFYYNFSIVYNIDHVDITFTDTSDVSHTCALRTTDGNATYPKLIDIGTVTNTYTVRFNNSASDSYFYINNFSGTILRIEIETVATL